MEFQSSVYTSALQLNAEVLGRVSVDTMVVFFQNINYSHCQDQHHPFVRMLSLSNITQNSSYEKATWYLKKPASQNPKQIICFLNCFAI